jgi:OOP family OmpA-OmpF porin
MTRSAWPKVGLPLVGLFFLLPNFLQSETAQAQTVSYAEAADRLAAACGKDIDEYCRGVNLGSGRMKNCLSQNRDGLSADCKETYTQTFMLIEKRGQARAAVLKLCDIEVRKLCSGVAKGDGQVLECILTASAGVSRKCNQAITDAGFR